MHNISMVQALDIWSELWQAYFGKNGFGGNTAEIYAYTLMPDSPSRNNSQRRQVTDGLIAASSLYSLLELFKSRAQCKIEIDGKEMGLWFKTQPLLHRCHVKIIRPKK